MIAPFRLDLQHLCVFIRDFNADGMIEMITQWHIENLKSKCLKPLITLIEIVFWNKFFIQVYITNGSQSPVQRVLQSRIHEI